MSRTKETETVCSIRNTRSDSGDPDWRSARIVSGSRVEFDAEAIEGSMNNTWNKIISGMRRRKTLNRFKWKAVISAAASVALIAGGLFIVNSVRSPIVVVSNENGQNDHIVLPDGSGVWLYYGASVRYPEKFDKYARRISLSGEAFFDVVHDETSRFIVSGELLEVEVFGTRFNVESDGNTAQVVLESGSVGISRVDGSEIVRKAILNPGEMGIVARENAEIRIEPVDVQLYTSWKDMYLVIKSQTLENVMLMLSKRYNVRIFMNGGSLRHETFTGRFDKTQTIEDIFGIINMTTPINYEYRDGAWTITSRYIPD